MAKSIKSIKSIAAPSELADMAAMLDRHGERFIGNNAEDEALSWIEHDFDTETADKWCEAGFWDAEIAAECRDAGLTADDATKAAALLVEECDDAAEEYTDGCPIYSVCNRDTPVSVIVEAARRGDT